jgi:hypothetical protein
MQKSLTKHNNFYTLGQPVFLPVYGRGILLTGAAD